MGKGSYSGFYEVSNIASRPLLSEVKMISKPERIIYMKVVVTDNSIDVIQVL